MIYLLALLITATAWALRYFYDGPPWKEEKYCLEQGGTFKRGHLPVVRWTPDSDRYLAQGRGEAQCWPFHARVAVGWLCGGSTWWWHVVTAGSLILTGPALCWYARGSGLTETQALAVVVGFSGLWGAFGLLTLCPVLVDAPAMLVSVLGAGAYVSGAGPWTLLVSSLLVGAIKETGPVWLALMAWHPVALVGLVVPAYRRWLMVHPEATEDIIKHPIKAASMYRRGSLTDGWTMVAPWGIGIASLLTPTPQLWCAVGVAYLQPLIASDVTRLVQNIAPIVLIHAVAAVPESYLPLALVLHLFNPWQKTEFERQPVRLQGIQ